MRAPFFTVAALTILSSFPAVAGAQDKKAPKTVTLSGCVQADETASDKFTLTDIKDGTKYRVIGKNFREYLGRPVELDGGIAVKGLKISGGLQPSANVAAQAGAMDPARAAVESATAGTGTGTPVDIQEFRVKAIRPASGSCR